MSFSSTSEESILLGLLSFIIPVTELVAGYGVDVRKMKCWNCEFPTDIWDCSVQIFYIFLWIYILCKTAPPVINVLLFKKCICMSILCG